MKSLTWKLMLLIAVLASTGWAQDDDTVDQGRGVVRVSLINGDVSVRRGDSGDWMAAAINAPLVAGDQLLTGGRSRAELQFDWANVIRLSNDAEVHLADLDSNRYVIDVARGTVTFSVLRDNDAQVEIDTPSVSVRPLRAGDYRVYVGDNGDAEITVRSGEADLFTPHQSQRLRSGTTMLVRGPASDPEYQVRNANGRDDWDRWNEDRDRSSNNRIAANYRYVDSSVYGAEDLDGYGGWDWVAPYGNVWVPRVSVGWAPYSSGRWSWLDYYGWTWVSYDPWGWAPYHYGRWFYQQPYGWCWWPGEMRTRHNWSPALVTFFGLGGWNGVGVGVGFGGGRIGWIPLAPNETYRPWYGRNLYRGYRNTTIVDNSIHIVNNTNIINVYRNARVVNGVSVVDAGQFGRGNASVVRASNEDLRRVDLVNGRLPVAPARDSLRVSDRNVAPPPAARPATQQRFFSPKPAPQVDRVPFEQQQRSMQQTFRRPAAETAAPRGSGAAAPQVQAPTARPQAVAPRSEQRPAPAAEQRPADSGWRRFGASEPARTAAPQVDNAPRQAAPQNDNTPRQNAPLRINPPIVRERETPNQQAPAPRVESPRQQAPAPAPRVESPRQQAPAPAPRVESPRQQAPAPAPRMESPRPAPAPAPRMESPRPAPAPNVVREAPRQEAPRQAAPAREAPRNEGGNANSGDARGNNRNNGR